MHAALPEFVPPMLASLGRPFDSDEHLFEIKWDGTRALAFLEPDGYRLLNRRERDMMVRYPELEFLARLPDGALLDGEIVVLREGLPDFPALLQREQARTRRKADVLARSLPATYVVFDMLYEAHLPIMDRPLQERRQRLAELVSACGDSRLVFSDGLVGGGIAYFDEVTAQGIEGVVAKRLDSAYLPGRRTDAWTKMKNVRRMHCAILGFVPDGPDDFKSLIIGSTAGGSAEGGDSALRCVGKVGSGLTEARKRSLLALMREHPRPTPLVDCGMEGEWVEPGLYCTVSFVEITRNGTLRAPVFVDLVNG